MKKLITLAILAAVLTASLTSCLTKKGNGDDTRTPGGVITTDPSTVTTTPVSKNPAELSYLSDNTAVYVKVDGAVLRETNDTTKTSTQAKFSANDQTKLVRTGISTDGSWSRVTVNGTEYYILTSSLTTDDLLAETFASVTEADCYIFEADGGSVNLRTYPSAENTVSPVITSIKTGTKVTILKTSLNGWVQIRGESNKVGYVLGKFLKDNPPITLDTDFSTYFTPVADKTMYVSTEKANLRKIPYSGNEVKGSIVETLEKGRNVTVIGEGTVYDSKWYQIDWVNKGTGGAPDQHVTYYLHATTLSATATASTSLEDYMTSYPALTSNTKTMYVSASSLNARSAPAVEKDDDGKDVNIVKSLKKKDQVNVVAIGLFDGTVWALAQDTNTSFYFVSYTYLTTDPEGKPVPATLTLESIQELYDFQAMNTSGTVKVLANLYNTPEVADDNKLSQLTAGSAVQIVGSVTVSRNAWFVIQYNDEYCFISQTQVTLS